MLEKNREIEVRFLEIDKKGLVKKLNLLGAKDLGEDLLEEIIFYDPAFKWRDTEGKMVRLRKTKTDIFLSYKHHSAATLHGTEEIEFKISDLTKGQEFLERLGLVSFRHQEKLRHTFKLKEVTLDIDTWPKVPTYVELEGLSEQAIKEAANLLGLKWESAVYESAKIVIEKHYNIPVGQMRWFTFKRFE